MTAVEVPPAVRSESTELAIAGSPAEVAALPDKERGEVITHALMESKAWLAVATKGTDPTPIAEFKAWAATVAEMTRQKGLAAEIQADALEMVRRAERGIGVAIRNGQEAGEILRPGQTMTRANQYTTSAPLHEKERSTPPPRTAIEFFPEGNQTMTDTYAMTDGVSDEQFEGGITEARAEGNLSRANVVRKIKNIKPEGLTHSGRLARIRELAPTGVTSQQIAREVGFSEAYVRRIARDQQIVVVADEVTRNSRRLDANRVIASTVMDASNAISKSVIDQLDFAALDREKLGEWISSLSESVRALQALKKSLEKELNHD